MLKLSKSVTTSGICRTGHAFGRSKALALSVCMLALSAAAFPPKAYTMADIKCKIEKREIESGFELTGIVWSEGSASGSYSLFVRKEGPSGRSMVSQQGLFAIKANESRVVGTVFVNKSKGDSHHASLSITAGEKEVCSAEA